jgi:hypothetical protein
MIAQLTRYFDFLFESIIIITEYPSQRLQNVLESRKIVLYAGVDPSAASLHVGNLAVLITLLHFHLHGHKVVSLVCLLPFPTFINSPARLDWWGDRTGR